MATASRFPNAVKNHEGVDLIDALLAPFFVAATLVMSGIGMIGIDNPVTFYLSDVLWSSSGTEVTWAFVITMGVITAAWVTNEARDLDEFSQEQLAVLGSMLLLNILGALVPAVSSALDSYWYAGLLLVMLNGAGYYLLAYY